MKPRVGIHIVNITSPEVRQQLDDYIISEIKRRVTAGGPGSGRYPKGSGQEELSNMPKGMHTHEARLSLPALHPSWKQHKDYKQQAYGGVVVNHKGQYLLVEPAGHWAGYVWTWPKGKMDSALEHPMDVASREVSQETGYNTKFVDHLPGNFKSPTGANGNFYIMRPAGRDASKMDDETANVRWAHYDEAKQLLSKTKDPYGRKRDLAILDQAHSHLTGKYKFSAEFDESAHPRDSKGKFADKADAPAEAAPKKTTSHGALTEKGWSKMPGKTPAPGGAPTDAYYTYKHPTKGTIEYYNGKKPGTKNVDYVHKDVAGNVIKEGQSGKGGSKIKSYLDRVHVDKPEPLNKAVEDLTKKAKETVEKEVPKLVVPEPAKSTALPAGMSEKYKDAKGQEWNYNPDTGKYHTGHSNSGGVSPDTAKYFEKSGGFSPVKSAPSPNPPDGMAKFYTTESGKTWAYNPDTGQYHSVNTGKSMSPEDMKLSAFILTPSDKHPDTGHSVPAGMPESFKTAAGHDYTFDKTSGFYESHTNPIVYHPEIDKEELKEHFKPATPPAPPPMPVGRDKAVVTPPADTSKAPPHGLPESVKGPKGGTYNWNHVTGQYEHKGGYTYTPAQVASKMATGKLADANPKPELAAKIPAGMYSHYEFTSKTTGAKWTAVYNPDTGMYDKFKGKVAYPGLSKTPAEFKEQFSSYKPTKNATLGTGTGTVAAKPVTTSPVVEHTPPPVAPSVHPTTATFTSNGDLTYKGNGSSLGGVHEKHLFVDKQGNQWMFKPATGAGGKMQSAADEAASKVQMLVNPAHAVEVKATTLQVPGKGEQYGSLQKMIPDLAAKKDFMGVTPESLTAAQFKSLQKEQVVDWMLSNHDTHGEQFLKTASGDIKGIDKSQAFKFFPGDKLTTDYDPNHNVAIGKPTYYNQMWAAVKSGAVSFDPHSVLPTIEKAQSIPDHVYKEILKPYAEAKFGSATTPAAQAFLDKATERKNNLKQDFEKLYSEVQGKPFSFSGKTYSAIPDKAAASGVSEDIHKTLENNGYGYKGQSKQDFAKYKDADGKTVYVKPGGNWEYYPMGSSSGNAYGSSKEEGAAKLNAALITPFEKPDSASAGSTSSYKSPAYKTDADGYPHGPLADVPYHAVHGVDPSGLASPIAGTKVTSAEKSALDAYKGSYSTSINDWALALAKSDSKTGGHSQDEHVKALDTLAMKFKTDDDLTVFRGLHGDYAKDLIEKIQVGDIHTPKSFQETSTSQGVSHGSFAFGAYGGLVLKISVPKGTPVIPTTKITGTFSGEKGMIFARNVSWKCNKIYKSGGKIYMDVDLLHPGVQAAIVTSVESEFTKILQQAAERDYSADQVNCALGTIQGPDGQDKTPASWKALHGELSGMPVEPATEQPQELEPGDVEVPTQRPEW